MTRQPANSPTCQSRDCPVDRALDAGAMRAHSAWVCVVCAFQLAHVYGLWTPTTHAELYYARIAIWILALLSAGTWLASEELARHLHKYKR